MLNIDVPGWKTLSLAHLFLDYNGTLALDGRILPGILERLEELSRHLVPKGVYRYASHEEANQQWKAWMGETMAATTQEFRDE